MASDRAGDSRDSFYDDIPNDSSATDNQLHQVDFLRHDLPQPYWPFIQPRERYILLEKHYLGEVKLLEDVMGRRLTPTEQEGIAYWSNKELQLRSRGSTLGVIGGAFRAYATRKHFNFPFWKPKETFNPNVLKVMGATIIEGRLARIFWHSARTSLYALVAGPIFSSIITSSWAITTAAAGRMKDPRTRDMFQAMREQHRQVMRQRQESLGQRRQMNTPTSRNASTGSQSSTNNEFGDSFSPDQPTFDPDSPQAGSAEYTNYNTYPSTNDDSSSSSSPSNRTFSSRSSPLNNRPTKSQNTPPFPREPERQDEQNMSSGFFDTPYDDASPATSNSTPFSSSASSPSSSSSSSGGGNAWERLRSGASNNSSNSQGEDAPTNQEEFDAKIERERRGRDF